MRGGFGEVLAGGVGGVFERCLGVFGERLRVGWFGWLHGLGVVVSFCTYGSGIVCVFVLGCSLVFSRVNLIC